METKIKEERAMMESLGDCPECGHDLPGVARLTSGRWQLFCTECRVCVIGPRDYAVKCWGLKEKAPPVAWMKPGGDWHDGFITNASKIALKGFSTSIDNYTVPLYPNGS